jgi:hypothetical protein
MELNMDFVPQLPRDSDQLKQTLAKAHRNCQEMELVGLQLEEAISRLEAENRQRRRQQLERTLQKMQNPLENGFLWETRFLEKNAKIIARVKTTDHQINNLRDNHWALFLSMMLTKYLKQAMALATYEVLEDGTFYGEIPGFEGVYAIDILAALKVRRFLNLTI